MQEKDLNTLITDYLWGNVSDEDIRRLRLGLDRSPELRAKFRQLLDGKTLAERYRQYAAIADYQPRQEASRWRRVARRVLPYAAVVALVLVAGVAARLWLLRYQPQPPVISEPVQLAMQQGREAERLQAEIEVSAYPLARPLPQPGETSTPDAAADAGGAVPDWGRWESAVRITTYQDKEYWLTLQDGTLVHLNYNTRLIYPEKFVGGTRDVVLMGGEAYFMVAQDRRQPFVVHTPQGDIRVHGTEFNVNTRGERSEASGESDAPGTEMFTEVVLVKGSVSVTPTDGTERKMQPGQKFSIHNSQLSIDEVDVEPYVAWNEGKFSFQAWPLDRVMAVLARWYGYEQVFFASDALRQKRLDGSFSRYDAVDNIMESIATVLSLDISFKEDTIIIQQ